MSLIKFNNPNRLFPWNNNPLETLLSSNEFFNNDLFIEDGIMPAMNIKEHKKDFEIEFAAPGFNKKDFEITIDDDVLNVCGEKHFEEEEKEEGYTRKEFGYNSFRRSLKLPPIVNPESNLKATYKNGILKLNLLKKDIVKEIPKKVIEVI